MLPVCVIHKQEMYYAQYNQMTDFETEYVFCKDYRLVLILECLFAKASTANASLSSWSSALFSGSTSSFALKQHTQIQSILAHTLKVAILTSYKKWSVRYFELKFHIHTLGISETNFTSCIKEHNRSPLKYMSFTYFKEMSWFDVDIFIPISFSDEMSLLMSLLWINL